MRVRLKDLQEAFEFVSASEEHQPFLCRQSGKLLLERRGALDQWHDFEARAEDRALRLWGDLNSIGVRDE